jgi:hypothetical protein
MAVASQRSGDRAERPFWWVLLAIAAALLLLGASGFWYLTASGPLKLLAGSDRPIATATAFVPAQSPFTLSLLTRPERIEALQQAMVSPAQRQQARSEIEQIKQSLLKITGLDYDGDLQPWIGNEATFAYSDLDLDLDASNAQQPGYLLALEIAPEHQQQARDFLQLFWQRQSLAGNPPQSEQISGVRVLYGSRKTPKLTHASALVGGQFVIFANDLRVLRRSIRAAQTATNLAQNAAYRQAVAQLPEPRIGLAYFDTALLGNASTKATPNHSRFTAIGLGITRTGLVANARFAAQPTPLVASSARLLASPVEALRFLPAESAIALSSQDLAQLEPLLATVGLSSAALPNFLQLGLPSALPAKPSQADSSPAALSPWNWATADYALGKIGSEWVLAVARDPAGIDQLDAAAVAQGYSAVPVTIGSAEATAWTRLKASSQRRPAGSGIETEILGLHLPQANYEIFASSLSAMNSALAAPQNSLLTAKRFTQAIASLPTPNGGYLYIDWPAIAPVAGRSFPTLNLLTVAARPLFSHIDTLVATREGETTSLFVQLAGYSPAK